MRSSAGHGGLPVATEPPVRAAGPDRRGQKECAPSTMSVWPSRPNQKTFVPVDHLIFHPGTPAAGVPGWNIRWSTGTKVFWFGLDGHTDIVDGAHSFCPRLSGPAARTGGSVATGSPPRPALERIHSLKIIIDPSNATTHRTGRRPDPTVLSLQDEVS